MHSTVAGVTGRLSLFLLRFCAILVFTKDVNRTSFGYLDFNDLIRRAKRYGIDVYAYSKMLSDKHPSDPNAEEYYESGEKFIADISTLIREAIDNNGKISSKKFITVLGKGNPDTE